MCRQPLKNLSEADRKSRAKSLFSDYLSSPDIAEARASVEELSTPGTPNLPCTTLQTPLQYYLEERNILLYKYQALTRSSSKPWDETTVDGRSDIQR